MKSILVDFYNLELDLADFIEKNWEQNWRVPKEERPKILEFFEKYAPKVLKYQTAEEIKALPKPIEVTEYSGTLGAYEEANKISWFDSKDAEQFYWDRRRIHNVIDGYLKKEIPRGHFFLFVKDVTKGFTPSILIEEKGKKELFPLVHFPETEIDLDKYQILRGQQVRGRWGLATSKVVSVLYEELVSLLEGKFELRRCAAEDCEKIFIPSPMGRKEIYHDKKCYWRVNKRKYRNSKK